MSGSSNPTSSPDPTIDRPQDFDQFWQETRFDLNNYPETFEQTLSDQQGRVSHYAIEFNSWQNTTIRGYLLKWQDSQPRPLIVYTHGYNGQCNTQWQWAHSGFNVFGFDTRGFGRSIAPVHHDGWILTNIESPLNSILRGAVCDYVRAGEIAKALTESSTNRTLFYGFSFGGAMALMAEALGQAADMVAAGVPTFGWMEGRRKLVKLGSGEEINHYIHTHPDREATIMRTLAYFDTVNFAPLIKKPTLIGIGKKDVIVPQKTVRAICSRLRCPFVIREFPYSHSNQPEEQLWQNFDRDWRQMALTGQLPVITQ